ncbi:hypothetical protein FAM09_29275 [Niastella caeni]|uniref:Methylamine utilisation protein MauE domain-containing protein n=1 Tax=Niastella caeni TaxID=2569763 RepID=A0A4S8HEX5_9BACT|nr:MauE/DoxX family redox-associated membrane protein [Niastella caeni]THU31172.1 hypothetical protein FAM09_29275 [Niastella caeni]
MITKALVKSIAIALAVLFSYAAVDKLEHYAQFSLQLQRFPLAIPVLFQQPWIIPVVELQIALSLLLPFSRLKGLFASLFLLSLYAIYLSCMLESRLLFTCQCGEPFQSLSLKVHIVLTLGCVFVTGVGVVLSGRIMGPSLRDLKKFPFVRPYYGQIDTSLVSSKN